eukprot:gene2035-4482_t
MKDMSTSHMISRGPPLTQEQLLQYLDSAGGAGGGVDILSKRQGHLRSGEQAGADPPAAADAGADGMATDRTAPAL